MPCGPCWRSATDTGPLRVTLDRDLVARPADGLAAPAATPGGPDLLRGGAILELKFPEALPALFRRLIEQHRLTTAGGSKYRLAVAALGLAGDPPDASPGP